MKMPHWRIITRKEISLNDELLQLEVVSESNDIGHGF